jgi:integrase
MGTTTIPKNLFVPLFKKFIADCKSGRRPTSSGKKMSKGAIAQYEIVYTLLLEFESLQSNPFRITILNSKSNRLIQTEKNYWKKFFKSFTGWLYQKKYFDIYVSAITKTLRTFFNYLIKDKCLNIGTFHLQFHVPNHNIIPIVLEPTQLKYLITNIEFHNSLSNKLRRTKDIFVFGCTVGLRYSDLMSLRITHIQETDEIVYIILNTSKTGSIVKIPLPQYAIEIIKKYRHKSGKFVLPRLSNTNINLNIKELIEKAGWTYSLPKIRFRQGKAVTIKTKEGKDFRFCDHITAHTMRRTAITTLLLLGVDENIVRTISGHAPGSIEFYKYVALVQNHLNRQVINAYEKMIL